MILSTPRPISSGDTRNGSDNRACPSPDVRRSTPPSSSSPPARIRGQFLILATPRPSQAIGHCPWKPWMNAAGVPVSESGDDCPREILVTSSSGRLRPTGWREWLGSRTPKGDASWRVIPSSSAVSANRYPSVRIESGHASKFGNCSRTPFLPFPDPVSSPSVSTKRWRSASSMKISSRRSPRFMT